MVMWERKPSQLYPHNLKNRLNVVFNKVAGEWIELLFSLGFTNSAEEKFTFKLYQKNHLIKLVVKVRNFLVILEKDINNKRDQGLYRGDSYVEENVEDEPF